ncbi:MAG: Rid family detoxifying hydrolase [Candidatus Zixiibacteriota bacterium]
MKKTIIVTAAAPKAIGAYNQAVAVEGAKLLFISGQIGLDPQSMKIVEGGVLAEAKQVIQNLGGILKEAGGDYGSVVKATIYLADINDFAAVNEIYASYFENDPPARAAFAVAALPLGARVEIEAIAAL